MNDMLRSHYLQAPGIGLAAIQIGILKRIVVMNISRDKDKKNPLFMVNPEITYRSNKTSIYEEGCLSLLGQFAEIERPAECQLKYIDYDGRPKELKANGLLSTCIQA